MDGSVRVGIIGDYNPQSRSHLATDEALRHSADYLATSIEIEWLATPTLEGATQMGLAEYDGLLCAPGSPYRSMEGAINAIRFARESDRPFIGTCGGFQHVVLEYARNVLGLGDAQHAEYNPKATRLVVTPLSCSLLGQALKIWLKADSKIVSIYGRAEVEEEYYCNYGLNPEYQKAIDEAGLRIVGIDDKGEARVIEMPDHRFFIATLYLPQHHSSPSKPHAVISSFLKAAREFRKPSIGQVGSQPV